METNEKDDVVNRRKVGSSDWSSDHYSSASNSVHNALKILIVISLSIFLFAAVSCYFVFSTAANEVEKNGGVGRAIGSFIGEVKDGIEE